MTPPSHDKDIAALIRLIDEPDERIFGQIRGQILSLGTYAVPMLENAWENTFDEFSRSRLEEIIQSINHQSVLTDLTNWAHFDPSDLLKGALLLSKYFFHSLDVERVTREIGQIMQDVWLEMNDRMNPLDKIRVINHILYDIHKFTVVKPENNSIPNYFIHNVLDIKRGNSLSLGVLYISTAQSLKLPVYGVDLPFNFVLSYLERDPGTYLRTPEEDPVMFYINPVFKGKVFIRHEIDRFLKESKMEIQPRYYQPCSNVSVLRRLTAELRSAFEKEGSTEKAVSLDAVLSILQ